MALPEANPALNKKETEAFLDTLKDFKLNPQQKARYAKAKARKNAEK